MPDSYELFTAAFRADSQSSVEASPWTDDLTVSLLGLSSPRYSGFIAGPASASFEGGLWRLLRPGGAPDLVEFNSPLGWSLDWPDMNGLRVFGYDWLGRLHAVDRDGAWSDRGQIVRFSPASGEIEEAADARSLDEYLFEELPRNSRDWLSADYFEDWQAEVRRPLATTECASYRTPLLLGGEDDVPNLELELLNVHLATCGQIYQQIVGLPEGAHVEAVRFKR